MLHDERRRWTRKRTGDGQRPSDDARERDGGDSETIRILLVDGNDNVRRGLTIALEIADDLQVIGEAASGAQAVCGCMRLRPDLVLMEIHLADQDGIGLIQRFRGWFPLMCVVVLTSDSSPELQQRVVSAGADAFLQKYVSSAELMAAIRTTFTDSDAGARRTAATTSTNPIAEIKCGEDD